MPIKIALPKGRLLKKTSALLQKAGWGLDEYHSKISFYHPKSQKFPKLLIKVLHERDIPIQVAVANYDLGICGLEWIEELLAKYPSSEMNKIKDLGYGHGTLYMVASSSRTGAKADTTINKSGIIRIASEYANIAESFALRHRLSRFNIFPVWGAAEVYPPENAELSMVSGETNAEVAGNGMTIVSKVLDFSAFLIANRNSWEVKDLGAVVNSICDVVSAVDKQATAISTAGIQEMPTPYPVTETAGDVVRLALPDGHQQLPTVQLLNKVGIRIADYPSTTGNRRPTISLDGVMVKVIRPQDMPLQVANGNFDLAITGRDWLMEHRYQFPSSPVTELVDLKFGKVKIVAVVSQELTIDGVASLRQLVKEKAVSLRVASEYVNIADKYARDNHLGPYRVIPTWGATEAFLPDDADLLIENTETGRTIARHNLKIIDTLFESTACLIGNTNNISRPAKKERVKSLIKTIKTAVESA